MALEFGGIDSKINDKADAYRNNPQQLQKRYGQNKQLVDLLALQKITAEKKEVAMNMALAAEGNPNTIADQRQQEALELTKKEMQGTLGELTGRTKDTLGQKQVAQQKGMQRIAKGAGKPPQGGLGALVGQGRPAAPPTNNPQMQGLAGARMAQAQQRGGPVRMAQGGIVSYAEGKLITLSDAQKEKARRVFGPDADARIANIEALRVDDPAAAALLNLLSIDSAVNQATEAVGKSLGSVGLKTKVFNKFTAFSNPVSGAFRTQSDEQQQYAKDVMSNLGDYTPTELQALLDADFNAGMSPRALAALPSTTPKNVAAAAAAIAPAIIPDADADSPAPLIFEPPAPYKTEVSQLPTGPIEQVTVDAPSELGVNEARTALLDTVGAMPPAMEVEKVAAAELAPVDPATYLTPQQLEAQGALISASAADFNLDPQEAIDAARISADEYSLRAEKQETARQQLARQEALNAKRLDPARVEQLKRMETYGGGAKYGRGGIGQAYVESERRYDDIEEGGLNSLATLEQNAITNDFNLVNEGILAGGRAGTRTQADKIAARQTARDMVTDGRITSTDQHKKKQDINTANALAQQGANSAEYKAALSALEQESATRRQILAAETSELHDATLMAVANSKNAQSAVDEDAQRAIEAAIASDEFVIELAKINRLDRDAAFSLYYEQLGELRTEKANTLASDQNFIDLQNNLAAANTEAEEEAAFKAITRYETIMESIMGKRFAFDYAKLAELRRRFETLSAANPLGSGLAVGTITNDEAEVDVVN